MINEATMDYPGHSRFISALIDRCSHGRKTLVNLRDGTTAEVTYLYNVHKSHEDTVVSCHFVAVDEIEKDWIPRLWDMNGFNVYPKVHFLDIVSM